MENAPSRDAPWDWVPSAYSTFENRLLDLDPDYPCHFGVHGHREGHNSFTALDRRVDAFGVEPLARTIARYRQRAWSGPKRQSLIVFVGPPDERPRLDEHREAFWAILRELELHDSLPWPEGAPRDPADPAWQWCFDGEPWFVFATSPVYRRRRSRNLGPCLTLVFQVRRVFEGLGGSSAGGMAAKAQVRARLGRYDTVPPHPHLGEPDRSSVHKWRQYFLPDDQQEYDTGGCPYGPTPRPVRAGTSARATAPEGLTLSVVDTIESVGREEWDRLFAAAGGSVFYSYDFLASIERRPLWNDATARYVVVRDASGSLLAALPVYWQEDASPFDTAPADGSRPRVLLGHVWHCYDTTLLSRVPVEEPLARRVWEAVRDLATGLGAARWGLVNVPRRGPLGSALDAAGLTLEDAPPRYRFVLDGRELTLDDHLATVGRSSRRALRQYSRRAERAGATVTFEQGSTVIADEEVLGLVAETTAKYTPGYYDLEALAALVHALGSRCRIMRLDLDGRLLATSICLFDATRMHTWAGGCRYPEELNWSPQYVLFAAELTAGFGSRPQVLECGRRNDEFKRRYGLEPYPLAQVVEHR